MAYVKGPRTSDGYINVNEPVNFKKGVLFENTLSAENPIGDTYFVRNNGADSNNGLSVDYAFKTLYAAIAAAGAWDRIIVLPSTDCSAYLTEAVSGVDDARIPLVVTQTGLKIIGGMTSEHMWGSPSLHTHTTSTILQVNTHQVEIANLAFHDQGAGCSLELSISADCWRHHVHDCYFGGNSTALWGVVLGNYNGSGVGAGATVDAPTSIIERCTFSEYVTGAVYFNGGYSVIQDCTFVVPANSLGIQTDANTSSRGSNKILRCNLAAISASTSTGISVVNTPDQGQLFIDGCRFVGFGSDDLCCTKRTGYMGLNYAGVTAVTITT